MNENLDLDLLNIFKVADNFNSYYQFIDKSIISNEIAVILRGYQEYYKTHKEDINFRVFVPWFFNTLHRNWSKEEIKYFKQIFSYALTIPVKDLECTLTSLREKKLWHDLEAARDRNFDTDKMESLILNYNKNKESNLDSIPYLTLDDALDEEAAIKHCFNWSLPTIQKHWGKLQQGQFYLVTAVSNTGKSSYVISEAVNCFRQLKGRGNILYFNNERSERSIFERFLCVLFKTKLKTIRENRASIKDMFNERYPDMPFKIFSARSGERSRLEINNACAVNKPSLIIIDLLDKLVSRKEEQSRTPYQRVMAWARDLAIKHDVPLIGVTQYGVSKSSDGEVKNTKMTQFGGFNSTVDKASNNDFMLGIQNVDGDSGQNKRFYLIRAKEGSEDVSFIAKFNRDIGTYEEY